MQVYLIYFRRLTFICNSSKIDKLIVHGCKLIERFLIISDPVFRVIFTNRLRPILASHAPRVRIKMLNNMFIMLVCMLTEEAVIIRIRVIASNVRRAMSR